MLLTKRNEYALQAMILLARHKSRAALSAHSLAAQLRTSPDFMAKIAQQLAAAGLVVSRRGKGGGLALARKPQRIRARDIFGAVDGALRVSQCMIDGRCRHLVCPIFPVLLRLQRELDRGLSNATLATLAAQGKK